MVGIPRLALGVAAMLATMFVGAADTPSRYDSGPRQAISAARAAWSASNPTNYRFKITQTCFCMSPSVLVTVRRGKVVKAVMEVGLEHEFSGKALPSGEWRKYFALPIPELLDLVDTVLQDRTLYSSARFDQVFGFPSTLDIRSGSMAPSDSDSGFSLEDFKVE